MNTYLHTHTHTFHQSRSLPKLLYNVEYVISIQNIYHIQILYNTKYYKDFIDSITNYTSIKKFISRVKGVHI